MVRQARAPRGAVCNALRSCGFGAPRARLHLYKTRVPRTGGSPNRLKDIPVPTASTRSRAPAAPATTHTRGSLRRPGLKSTHLISTCAAGDIAAPTSSAADVVKSPPARRVDAPSAAHQEADPSAPIAATTDSQVVRQAQLASTPEAPESPQRQPPVVVLGIESSCDDTGVAVVTSDGRVLGEAIATQADIHSRWGGVVPNLARDAHAAAIDRTVESALAAAGLRPQQLSAIAVTIGPGLGLCLRVGASKARQMSRQYGIPLVSVHHMEAHALVARLPAAAAATAAPVVRLAAAPVAAADAAASASGAGGPAGASRSDGPAGGEPPSSQQPLELCVRHESVRHNEVASEHASTPPSATAVQLQQQIPQWLPARSPHVHQHNESVDGQGNQERPSASSASLPGLSPPSSSGRNGGSTTNDSTTNDSTTNDSTSRHFATAAAPECSRGDGGGIALDPDAVLADVSTVAAVPFPFLCLLISGGHNLLVLVRGVGRYVQLGTTADDALGEAYDKVARLLALELRPHGGAALEALAREGDPAAFKFAVPMRRHATCDFSFAGLKTNTRLAIEQHLAPERVACMAPEDVRKVKADIAASFQHVAVTHLIEKSRRGVAWAREVAPEVGHLVVAGGVACNLVIRSSLQRLADSEGLELVLPPPRWCTDNGVMVAWAGIERLARGWAEPPPPPSSSPPPSSASTASRSTPIATAPEATLDHASALIASPSLAASAASIAEPAAASTAAAPAADPAAAAVDTAAAAAAGGEEWIELKPRWPLTSEVHPRIAAAQQEQRRSIKRVRMATPLSDLTPPALGAR